MTCSTCNTYYSKSSTNKCEPTNCQSKNTENKCTLCNSGYYLTNDYCKSCDTSCLTCDGGTATDCKSCVSTKCLHSDGSC